MSNRRSTTEVVIEMCRAPIIFKSRQQPIIASSTTEAEYIAANVTLKELQWLKSLLNELYIETSLHNLYIYNQAAIRLITTQEFRAKTKHIDIKYHYIQEKFKEKLFKLDLQKADLLTKSLPPIKHEKMCQLLGLPITTMIQYMLLMSSILTYLAQNISQHEDPLMWNPASIYYVEGQVDWSFKLGFYNPCKLMFENMTGVPYIDDTLTDTCNKRFDKDITQTLSAFNNSLSRVARDGGLTVAIFLGLSAMYVSTYATVRTNAKINRETAASMEMIKTLETRLNGIQEEFIISNQRISSEINSIKKNSRVLANVVMVQPEITDALIEAFLNMHNTKQQLNTLRRHLEVCEPVPLVLLDLFNLTEIPMWHH